MIKRHVFMVMAAVLVAAAFVASAEDPEELTVYAAASLTGAFGEIGEIFENETGMQVAFNFDNSQALSTQIENGAYADVFASANKKQMNAVADGRLINNSSMVIFAKNKMALIIPTDNPAQINNLSDLARSGLKIVMVAREAPAGDYAMQIIGNLANDSAFGPDYRARVLANVISEETNVNYVVAKVALGEADVGFAYVSDINEDLAGKVEKIDIPDEYNVIGEYPIAVMQDSMYPAQSQRFIDLVLSDEGRAVLGRCGFSPA